MLLCRDCDDTTEDRGSLAPSGRRSHLIERAGPGLLIRAPTQELRAVSEAAAGEMVVAHLADQGGAQRLPLGAAPLAPAAWAARRLAREAGRLDQGHEDRLELAALRRGEAGREPHVIEPPLLIVEPEEE